MKESRSNLILTQALLVSGALNMLFIALFFFLVIQEAPLYLTFRHMKASIEAKELNTPIANCLLQLKTLTMDELINCLEDQTVLEEGIQVRDVALALLTEEHHFDLSRALLGFPPCQQRVLKIAGSDGITLLTLTTHLTTAHYKAITDFAKHELFPMTEAAAPILPKLERIEKIEPPKMQHIVQEGESLWKISRMHQVDIDLLRSLNHLRSDQIKPGQVLALP
jgi:LysM repeat protein